MIRLKSQSAPKTAVAYYRRSTRDKQEYSIPIQQKHASEFAKQHNITILHEFEDRDTGLSAQRPGFQKLLSDWVSNPSAPHIDYILVYDDSRWGRFPNINEAAAHEFECNVKGIQVIYVADGFPKEGGRESFITGVTRAMKRSMAAEYSRELGEKVFNGCMTIASKGYSVGGAPAYGMARVLLKENKERDRILLPGEHKAIANARVIFEPRNDETTKTVQQIFQMFVEEWRSLESIAQCLNDQQVPSPQNKKWKSGSILRILTNEVYIGTHIYNKTWGRLRKSRIKNKTRKNHKSKWVIVQNAFKPTIQAEVFDRAQERLFWLMPSRWKHGIYAIRKARRTLVVELERLLIEQKAQADYIYGCISDFPVLFGAAFYLDTTMPRWCFFLPDQMRRHDHVLGIGLDLDRPDPIDRIFLIPTKEFNAANCNVFSEQDQEYFRYALKDDKVENEVIMLARSIVGDGT